MNKAGTAQPKGKRGASKRPTAKGRPSSFISSGKGQRRKARRSKRSHVPAGLDELPSWLHWVLAGAVALLLLCLAYSGVIRKYSYRWKPCYGASDFELCLPHAGQIYGIDISHHQGDVDWVKVAAASAAHPIRFAYIKATEGGDFKDDRYDGYIEAARKVGIACGSYLFFNPDADPGQQARFFIDNVSMEAGDLPPVVDVERRGTSKAVLQHNLLECLRIIEAHYGVRPIIYSSYKFRNHYLDIPDLDRYKFWIARYYVDKPDESDRWILWQFSNRGRVDGIEGHTDINVFNGSFDDFSLLHK